MALIAGLRIAVVALKRSVRFARSFQGQLRREYVEKYKLNTDQAEALWRMANMFSREKTASVDSVLLIHGLFLFYFLLFTFSTIFVKDHKVLLCVFLEEKQKDGDVCIK